MSECKILVTTTTHYPDPKGADATRLLLACNLVLNARALGHTTLIVDGSSDPCVEKLLRKMGALVFPQMGRGMGAARRQVWCEAQKLVASEHADAILWCEEKPDITRFLKKMYRAMRADGAQALIPTRSAASWETYPAYQRESEKKANEYYNTFFPDEQGRLFDPMFGPVLFLPEALHFFTDMYPQRWSAADTYVQHYAPIVMRSQGMRVATLEVDFFYPVQQRAEELGSKAAEMIQCCKWQLEQLLEGCALMKKFGKF